MVSNDKRLVIEFELNNVAGNCKRNILTMVVSDGTCKLFHCFNDRVGMGKLFNRCGD